MKKLLTILFCIISLAGVSQPVINRSTGANTVNDPRLMASLNFFAPRYADTTTANVSKGVDSCGAIIFTYDINAIWYRQCSPKKWIQIVSTNPPPPLTPSSVWYTTGNYFLTTPSGYGLGTISADNLPFKTTNVVRMTLPAAGLLPFSSSNDSVIVRDVNGNLGVSAKGAASNAWELTGNSGTTPSINFWGSTDSVGSLSHKNGTQYIGFYERRGWDVYPYVRRPGLTAVGTGAANTLIPLVIAGTTNGQLNTIIGGDAGARIGATDDTSLSSPSTQNTMVGVWAGHDIQNNSYVTSTGRNVLVGESTCFTCLTPGEVTAIGSFVGERGNRPYKNTGLGSNALRTMGDSYGMTSLGAYANAYTGSIVYSVTMDNVGSGYTTATVTFSAPPLGTVGTCAVTATGTANIVGGQITSITITNPGCGYNSSSGTRYPGYSQPYPTVTITGDGTGATGTVVTRDANNTVAIGHTSDWFDRAGQFGIHVGSGSGTGIRYWDNYCASFGYGSGIDASVSPLSQMTKAWAFGTGATVSTNNTVVFGGIFSDTNKVNFVINNPSYHSTTDALSVYGTSNWFSGYAVIDSANVITNGSWTSPFPDTTLPCTNCQTNFYLGINAGQMGGVGGGLNTAVGFYSQQNNVSQFHNTSVGSFSLRQNTTFGNTAIGTAAMNKSTNWSASVAVGAFAMYKVNAQGVNPGVFPRGVVSIGYGSMSGTNNNGEYNLAIGPWAGSSLNGGNNNVSIGAFSMGAGGLTSPLGGTSNATGAYNVTIGTATGFSLTSGSNNLFSGTNSGRLTTTGSHNVFLGDSSGINNIGGGNNVYLGSYYGTDFVNANYHLIVGNNDVKWFHGDSTGAVGVGVGVTSPATTSIFEVKSTTRGFLLPRMNSTQESAISSPATSLLIFNTDTAKFRFYNGSAWETIGGATGASGANTALSNLASVSINTSLIPQTGVNLGAQATPFKNLWLYGGGTFGSHSIKLDGTPTGHRTVTIPDATTTMVGTDVTQTLTNKRWTARVGSTTSSATPTINTDNVDIYKLTAQAAAITSFTTNLSGTPSDGDILEIQITDDGTARAITWGASFVSSTVTLPTTTVISTTLTVIFQYYTTSSYGNNKWVIANYY